MYLNKLKIAIIIIFGTFLIISTVNAIQKIDTLVIFFDLNSSLINSENAQKLYLLTKNNDIDSISIAEVNNSQFFL